MHTYTYVASDNVRDRIFCEGIHEFSSCTQKRLGRGCSPRRRSRPASVEKSVESEVASAVRKENDETENAAEASNGGARARECSPDCDDRGQRSAVLAMMSERGRVASDIVVVGGVRATRIPR
ncbi:uncharacterized protein LOC122530015 [Frieseomelitta varia]|uniref:uncharacterized protein LOC122530015 n=1 Tax=Frieseomelitta varia TaxID=561572 RepID=UPI001CB697D8|nr:uncharacterized protein LOC122530015 [Frieseomelitta varia]